MPFRILGEPWKTLGGLFGGILGSGPRTKSFLPSNVAELQLWLDFSDVSTLFTDVAKTIPVTTNGDAIGAAEDKSGNGNDGLQAVGAAQPLYQVAIQNGLSVSKYDGANDFIRSTFVLNQPCTYYIVFSQITWTLNERIIDGSVAQAMIFQSAVTPRCRAQASGVASTEIILALGTFGIATAIYNGANSSLRLNDGASPIANIGGNNPGGVVLGARTDGAVNGNINIGELLVFSDELSTADDARVLSFLNSKWDIF